MWDAVWKVLQPQKKKLICYFWDLNQGPKSRLQSSRHSTTSPPLPPEAINIIYHPTCRRTVWVAVSLWRQGGERRTEKVWQITGTVLGISRRPLWHSMVYPLWQMDGTYGTHQGLEDTVTVRPKFFSLPKLRPAILKMCYQASQFIRITLRLINTAPSTNW